jgi:hypothetical protein
LIWYQESVVVIGWTCLFDGSRSVRFIRFGVWLCKIWDHVLVTIRPCLEHLYSMGLLVKGMRRSDVDVIFLCGLVLHCYPLCHKYIDMIVIVDGLYRNSKVHKLGRWSDVDVIFLMWTGVTLLPMS